MKHTTKTILKPGTGITFERNDGYLFEGTIVSHTEYSSDGIIYTVDVNGPGGGAATHRELVHRDQIVRKYL